MTRPSIREEKKLWKAGFKLIAGLDEAGKGAWAGPLVAAAVIMPLNYRIKGINDSKKLQSEEREKLYVEITKIALSWSVCVIDNKQIDKKGIFNVNLQALLGASQKLHFKPEYLLIDALEIKFGKIPVKAIINGDEKIYSIAAASIIAKVTRDEVMKDYHRLYPQFCFHLHKGYGTDAHFLEIKKHGLLPIHRRSFAPIKNFTKH